MFPVTIKQVYILHNLHLKLLHHADPTSFKSMLANGCTATPPAKTKPFNKPQMN